MSDDRKPDPERGAEELRVVTSTSTAGRRGPDQRSEMTTQWVCGEVLRTLDADGRWLKVRGPDGYTSWVHRGGLLPASPSDAASWREAATARSLGVALRPVPDGGPARLPWGARVVPEGEGRVRLPDGTACSYEPADAVVDASRRRDRFPPQGETVARTALRWRGVPYLWGGRTRAGADCSGFVQAVYAMHGVRLPRDSGEQLAAGPALDGRREAGPAGGGRADARRAGDLLFFGGGPDDVTHVAVVVEGARVVHAAAENGSVAVDALDAETSLSGRLRRRLVGATRPLASG